MPLRFTSMSPKGATVEIYDPKGRHWDEPIEHLPRPRNSRRDCHHLFWPASDMTNDGFQELRDLPCAKANSLDSMVHSLIHMHFNGIVRLRGQGILEDFRGRAA